MLQRPAPAARVRAKQPAPFSPALPGCSPDLLFASKLSQLTFASLPPFALTRAALQWGEMHGVRVVLGAGALAASMYGVHALLTRS